MKRTITILSLLLLISSYLQAQTSAGNFMAGGSIQIYSASNQNNDDYDYSSVNFSPSIGYFVSDNFAVGLNVGISSQKTDNGFTSSKQTTLSFGPFARYYKFTSNEQFAFFAQAGVNVGSGKEDNTPGGETKSSFVNFNISPGFAYFFNNHWAAELSFVGFSVQSNDPNKDAGDDKYSSVIFDIRSLNPSLGIRYHFGGN
jgi:outer membrane protein